jgi:hypothetical protein
MERFEFAFAPSYSRIAAVFGIRPASAWIEVDENSFDARFGRWRVRTPLANIRDVAVTGPYRFFKTAGPARLAITDRGLTFATNGRRGVRISFKQSVPGLDPFGLIRHPELTVTVSDIDRLSAVLKARTGVPNTAPSSTAG